MRIVSLTSENVKRLSAVEITPAGDLVVIGGRNGAGKTSVLDSIAWALGGKGEIPSMPIRRGADKAEVVVDLGDLKVKRTFTAKGSYLSVETSDGAQYRSPQAMLDGLVGRLSFDPLEFSRMKPAAQEETLRDLLDLDQSAITLKRDKAFVDRREIKKRAKALEAQVEACQVDEELPTEAVSIQALLLEREDLQEQARERVEAVRAVDEAKRDGHLALLACEKSEEAVRSLSRAMERARSEADGLAETVKVLAQSVEEAAQALESTPTPDFAKVDQALAQAEATNANARTAKEKAELSSQLSKAKGSATRLTTTIGKLDNEKADQVAAADFPVEGLGFAESGVTFEGIPLEQISSAQLTRVSTAIGVAANPKLRVMFVRDGSLLDDDSMDLMATLAKEANVQIWIERVGEGAECTVIIEDGHVQGVSPADDAQEGSLEEAELEEIREPEEAEDPDMVPADDRGVEIPEELAETTATAEWDKVPQAETTDPDHQLTEVPPLED